MDWIRLARAKELRRMSDTTQQHMTRNMQHSDKRNISNGALTAGARQLSRLTERGCVATMGSGPGSCSTVG